jgi:hypothetical protein
VGQDSSLDRFLKNRAVFGLGLAGRRSFIIQTIIGCALVALSLCFCVAPAFGAPPEMVMGAIGPFIGGTVNLAVAQALRRKIGAMAPADWNLSREAKGLLLRLVRRRLGWLDGNPFTSRGPMPGMPFGIFGKRMRHQLRTIASQTGQGGIGWTLRPAQEVAPDLIEILETAAGKFNRIQGLISTPTNSAAFGKVGPSAMKAADEAMADILHDAASMDKYPESGSTARRQIEARIASLSELGDRLDELATHDQGLTDRLGYTSAMDSVLEELRLEQLARSELQVSETTDQHLQA